MLCLNRKTGQTLVFTIDGRRVVVKVEGRGHIKCSVDAPRDVRVLRGELEAKGRAA